MSVDRFFNAIPNAAEQPDREITSFFVYYLSAEQGLPDVTTELVGKCFTDCDLSVPKRLRSYLSEGVTQRPQRYTRTSAGYRLQRHFSDALSSKLGDRRVIVQTSVELRALESGFAEGPIKTYLGEAIDCFEAGANRGAVIMTWVLTMEHFLNFVFAKKLTEFNAALKAQPDKKVKEVTTIEDFQDLREKKIIELCRTADIITNDVRKVLDDCLGVRNSAAHPSDVKIGRSKAISVIDDLVSNVIKKF